tara:strand:- start:169 stop:498 length:330 start_codon:yes stop_codon:yes gene_type:complete
MANAYKTLGQVADASANNVTLYTVPASTETVVSTIVICNREGASNTFRIAVRPNGATLANEHYLAYDSSISANDTITMTLGITVDASDVISVGASDANVSFNIFGTEIS